MSELKEGDEAPLFTAVNDKGEKVSLSDYKGRNVVLYFYPKDDTPGCTIEAKEFTEAASRFADNHTVVLGVSYDDTACHGEFIKKYNLKIELLTDEGGKIAQNYQSAGVGFAKRNTFVIDKQGKIRKIFWGVNPKGHAQEVLEVLKN